MDKALHLSVSDQHSQNCTRVPFCYKQRKGAEQGEALSVTKERAFPHTVLC